MLQAMGWQEGKGLGRHQQGITAPISVRNLITVYFTNEFPSEMILSRSAFGPWFDPGKEPLCCMSFPFISLPVSCQTLYHALSKIKAKNAI